MKTMLFLSSDFKIVKKLNKTTTTIVLVMFLVYLISSMMMRKVMGVFFLSPKLQMVSLEKGLWMKPPTAMPSNK
jgi:hypothetical protein